MTITQTAYDAFRKVLGLRDLAYESNMSTQRTRNAVLQRLDVDDLGAPVKSLPSTPTPTGGSRAALANANGRVSAAIGNANGRVSSAR